MLGAITGDIFCASYEFDPEPHENVDLFERHRFFTDDTVLTIATAAAIFLARNGATKKDIRREITDRFHYDLTRTIAEIRPAYHFNETCQGSVPEALTAFLDADDFEHTLRLVISLGGDADTQAAIAGAVAEAIWGGIPEDIETEVDRLLPSDMAKVITAFSSKYRIR